MKRSIPILLLVLVGICRAADLYICCAAGIRMPVKELCKDFEALNRTHTHIIISSSGKLAKQIEMGAPCNLFISASPMWIDYLKSKGLTLKELSLARTSLVIVSSKNIHLKRWKDMCAFKRIAIGNYKFAPCGKYTMESFKHLNIWECLKDKLVLAGNVAQAATWAILGEVDAAVVYYSDYLLFKDRLKILKSLPEDSHTPITFKAAIITEDGLEFLKFICRHKEVFKEWGFELVCR